VSPANIDVFLKMPDTPPTVRFHYIKSGSFRVIHTDGAIGGVTPGGLIFVGLYSERGAIPQMSVYDITEAGQPGAEHIEERVSKQGIVREVEVGATMSIETATNLLTWLQEKIDFVRKLRKTSESEGDKTNGTAAT
jgi:hypothetical protein